jgi:hypothetical protein
MLAKDNNWMDEKSLRYSQNVRFLETEFPSIVKGFLSVPSVLEAVQTRSSRMAQTTVKDVMTIPALVLLALLGPREPEYFWIRSVFE